MTAPPRPPRTLVASVLFVDLVDFSEKSVSEQIEVKRALTRVLRRILSSISAEDYRLMDTGDGAALGFLADPEHALYFALAIDAACNEAEPSSGLGPGTLRIGINLGPVKDVFDVNDRPNLIGDGINTAQRIVSFAEPGQITMSRSFFELVSRLAPEYSGIFVHVGEHDDKHGRAHDLYVIKPAKDMLGKIQERLQLVVAEATGINVVFTQKSREAAPPVRSYEALPAAVSPLAPPTPVSIPETAPIAETASIASVAQPKRSYVWPMAIAVGLLLVGAIILAPLLTKKAVNKPISPPPVVSPAKPADAASAKSPAASPSGATTGVSPGTPATTPTSSMSPSAPTSSPASAKDPTPTTGTSRSVAPGNAAPPPAGASSSPTASPTVRPSADTAGAVSSTAADKSTSKRAPRASSPTKRSTATDGSDDAAASATANPGGTVTRGSYSRCSTLMQKATLGETLTAGERREMEQFCR